MNLKEHWDQVFATRQPTDLSWFQPDLSSTISLISQFDLPHDARIVDIGGGDSHLAEALLDNGFTDVHVLDISANAIDRAQRRLGERAKSVRWIESDVTQFTPDTTYDLWHDRAALHFLTSDDAVGRYVKTAAQAVKPGGYLIVATFSTKGPKKCSGLEIRQYDEEKMTTVFSAGFERVDCSLHDHITPSKTTQNFQYCVFRKKLHTNG